MHEFHFIFSFPFVSKIPAEWKPTTTTNKCEAENPVITRAEISRPTSELSPQRTEVVANIDCSWGLLLWFFCCYLCWWWYYVKWIEMQSGAVFGSNFMHYMPWCTFKTAFSWSNWHALLTFSCTLMYIYETMWGFGFILSIYLLLFVLP